MQQAGIELILTSCSSGWPYTGPQNRPAPPSTALRAEHTTKKEICLRRRTSLHSNKMLRKGDDDDGGGAWQKAAAPPRDQKTQASFYQSFRRVVKGEGFSKYRLPVAEGHNRSFFTDEMF